MDKDNQDSKPQALQFPIEHSKCPVCGEEGSVVETVRDEQVANGKMRDNVPVMLLRCAVPVA